MNPTKTKILETVIKLLADSSKRKLTISNVADETGIGKSTIYEHFKNKDEMIHDAIILMIDYQVNALLDSENLINKTFEEAFKAYMSMSINETKNNNLAHYLMQSRAYNELPVNYKQAIIEHAYQAVDKTRKYLKDMFEIGFSEGLFQVSLNTERFYIIESLIFGVNLSCGNPMNDWDIDMLIEELYKSIILLLNEK